MAVLLGAAVACSVYRVDDLVSPITGGTAGDAGAGDSAGSASQAGSGAGGNNGGSGGSTPEGGSSAAGTSGSGPAPSGGSTTGGTSAEGGSAGDEGVDPGPDDCPDDPTKREPGACGCGIPEESTTELASCQSLVMALSHRYDFEGTGDQVLDRVGNAHGKVIGGVMLTKLEGRGVVDLTGGTSGPYVDLPNELLSSLTSVTVEAWLTWRGGNAWQRIFDFGDSTAPSPEDSPALGKTYLFATPRSASGVALASYSHDGNANGQQLEAASSAPLPQKLSQVVVVANGDAHKLVLYIDGDKVSEQGWTGSLSRINDVNVWLGRSQYAQDPELNAVLHEFRVYDEALSDAQVATAFRGGPDPSFLLPAPN
jgi:Concanavalin A-like lectin/glucanases superfamily